MKFCPKCGNPELDDNAVLCSVCGASMTTQTSDNSSPTTNHPMKWYNFLIYFALIVSAVLNILTAISNIRIMARVGGVYKTIILIEIIVAIAFAALAIVTRQKLAGYKQDAPKFITYYYLFNLVWAIVLGIILSLFLNVEFDITSIIINIAVSSAMIAANKTYFDKRKDLFCK